MLSIVSLLAVIAPLSTASGQQHEAVWVAVGSKNFTEQQILGEIVAQVLERSLGARVERRFGLGGTDICHAAMLAGQLDVYVEYSGTALVNVLGREASAGSDEAFRRVARQYRSEFDLEWLPPIGFNNTYAIAVRGEDAAANGWTRVSDLAGVESLRWFYIGVR